LLPRERQGLFAIAKAEMRHRYAREHGAFPGEQPSFPSDRQCLFECFERTVPCAVQDVRDPETQVACDSPELVPHLLRVFDRIPGVRQGRRALASHLTAEDVEYVRSPAHAQLWKRPLEHRSSSPAPSRRRPVRLRIMPRKFEAARLGLNPIRCAPSS